MSHPDLRRTRYWVRFFRYGCEEAKLVKSVKDVGILYNKFVYLIQRTRGGSQTIRDIPPGIQIEPTNYCNARCICCSTERSTRKRGFMDFALFAKIIDDARKNKMRIVHLYLHGEPLLHPNITEMISYTKKQGLAVHLTTNGMALTPEKIIAILKCGVDLSDHFTISVLGVSKEVHELVMKRINHERVLSNIDSFLKLRRDLHTDGPIIETMFYPMPENQHEIQSYLKNFRGYVDHARLASKISIFFANYGTGKRVPALNGREFCAHVRERLTVFWNGDITFCQNDLNGDWVFGNLANQSIQEVCSNEKMLNLKALHANHQFDQIPLCSQCDA